MFFLSVLNFSLVIISLFFPIADEVILSTTADRGAHRLDMETIVSVMMSRLLTNLTGAQSGCGGCKNGRNNVARAKST